MLERKLGVPFAEDAGNEAEKEKDLPVSEATPEPKNERNGA